MSQQLCTRYRPTKTSDTEGGFTETLGTAYPFYGIVQIHKDPATMLTDKDHDVIVGDIVAIAEDSSHNSAQYRVKADVFMHGTRMRQLTLDRIERPITP